MILGYDCNKNNDKALKVAKNLVNNWYTAYVITRNENISFYAILHPTIFSSDASYEFFTEEWKNRVKHLTPQFDVVYPLIKEALRQKCIEDDSFCRVFYDGSNWIPAKTKVFIDDTHLNNEGNLIIAEKLSETSEKLVTTCFFNFPPRTLNRSINQFKYIGISMTWVINEKHST